MYAAHDAVLLPDVQATRDTRRLAIQRVGVKAVRFPVSVELAGVAGHGMSVATVDMYVGLPAHEKGTHMSRFLEVLHDFAEPISFASLHRLMRRMLDRLEADSGEIAMRMPCFIMKQAPVSGVPSLLDYEVAFHAVHAGGRTSVKQEVLVPVTSLCPCSKEISAYGAHNQRSHVRIRADLSAAMPVEDMIRIAEDAASCEVYGLLKRPDEKYVTERAYDNPKFVEDLVRDIALRLDNCPHITGYTVESENFESIHNHSAYACIEGGNRSR